MIDNNIRILHIFSGVGGGISTWIRKAAIHSKYYKYNIVNDAMAFYIDNSSEFIDIVEKNGGACIQMPRIGEGIIKLILFISDIIKNGNYSVVHCHIDGIQALPIWIAASVISRKKTIIHSHRTAIEKIAGKKYEKLIYKLNRIINNLISDKKIACGLKAKEFAFGNSKDVRIFYNGINLVKDYSVDNKKVNTVIKIVALGRLSKVKNHIFMLDIAEELKHQNQQFHLYIVGDGELSSMIHDEIVKRKLECEVSLEGYCDKPQKYLIDCNTLILPSFSEGLPTVMLEAQEYGCNVISSCRVTRECDLDLGFVSYLDIKKENISKWVKTIIDNSNKKNLVTEDKINEAIKKKGFLNQDIYKNYYDYIKYLEKT